MNNSSNNIAGNGLFPQNFSHGLMMNGSAANNTTTNFVGGPDVLTSNSNITFDVSQIDGMGHQSREYKMEQVESDIRSPGQTDDLKPHQLMGRTANTSLDSSFPHSFYQIHPGNGSNCFFSVVNAWFFHRDVQYETWNWRESLRREEKTKQCSRKG